MFASTIADNTPTVTLFQWYRRVPPGEDPGWSILQLAPVVQLQLRTGGPSKRRILLQGTRKSPGTSASTHNVCELPAARTARCHRLVRVGGRKTKEPIACAVAATGSWKSCACPSAALSQHGHQARDEGHMPSTWICASEQRVVRPPQIKVSAKYESW